jgi:hypothetical protein
MTPEIWAAIIASVALLLSAIVAVLGYERQKSADLKASLVETQRGAYRNFLTQLPKLANSSPEIQEEYYKAVADLNLVASDYVVFCVGEFSQYMNGTAPEKRDPKVYKKLIAKIAINMRKDCFKETELSLDTIAETLPFR